MEKILVIGELSDLAKKLEGDLDKVYQIQFCGRQLADVQAMTRIVKPAMLIFYPLDGKETDREIMDWARDKCKVPVLLVTTSEGYQQFRDYMEEERFDKLLGPVNKEELQQKCSEMLGKMKQQTAKTRSRKRKKTILVVDDAPLMLRKIKNILDRQYDVMLASSGKQALESMYKKEPDLVLLDYQMPDMNGKEVFEKMLADGDLRYIPVVFLTSVSDRKTIISITKLKPADYILKPPDQERLMNTIQTVLK